MMDRLDMRWNGVGKPEEANKDNRSVKQQDGRALASLDSRQTVTDKPPLGFGICCIRRELAWQHKARIGWNDASKKRRGCKLSR